ncbi:cytosine specific DNA methyltransferase [Companilactobacillus tucceti DSM 20183]|uniref:Cytosine-specific methyltransferase n=1 Tax=Companilactobacillus tucceti DSM 20183 TaxID=1423811 RepID=A0A0R1J2P1_9LACO|nr:DNA cytosine methyltransferase [Companilactobacillus tucceti]KRK65307.1 cytosine specific DNA methyltransferase [Companilactobacillus tucceti DSM 20183]
MIRVVDLFSGVGGLTFGFQKKIYRNRFVDDDRFDVLFANEWDKSAAVAFKKNFSNITMLNTDISEVDRSYLDKLNINVNNVDLVIGGPPCQSFSTVGKRQYDNRAKMYREYRRMLSILKPKMFIFENVLGLLTMHNDLGNPVIDDVKSSFENLEEFGENFGYKVYESVLNAEDFGVPQSRKRVFLVGVRKDLKLNREWKFPSPVNSKHITVSDAISDLPYLVSGSGTNAYHMKPKSRYQYLMRGNQKILKDHISGVYGERMKKIIAAVPEGESKPYINKLVLEKKLPKELYLSSGYNNTYGRLWWNKPSTTITNNLSTPSSLRCIHPKQDRALTSREGARIQSFPDDFSFVGPKNKINSQIGNAVPPVLSIHLADSIFDFFKNNL